MSERGRESDIIVKQSSDPFIIEFISASDIPLYDGKNKSDPYIQAFISTHVEKTNANNIKCFVLKREGNLVQTPHRVDCTSVVWNCYRDFNIKPSVEAVLTVQLYHRNKESTKCVMLGKIDIPVNKLANELPTTFPLYVVSGTQPGGKDSNFAVTLRRVFMSSPPAQFRTFFLIRHGESKWNEAQAKINITGMLDRDHALTEDGINQACALNARWKLAKSQGKAKFAADSNRRASITSELIDYGRLVADDLVAVGGNEEDSDSEEEGGESKQAGKGLGRLYDSFFMRHSNVTATGKTRNSVTTATGNAPHGSNSNASPLGIAEKAGGVHNSYVPSFVESDLLDFTTDSPASTPPPPAPLLDFLDEEPQRYPHTATATTSSSCLPPALPPVVDPFDLLDGYSDVQVGEQTGEEEVIVRAEELEKAAEEGEDLPGRREEYIRLFMRADIVYSSPLTRALQTALAAMCDHPALEHNCLTMYSIIREIKRIGGLDTVGVEMGAGIMRRVKAELQLAMGVARAHEITDFVKADVNDAATQWWTSVSGFENSREQLDRVREFITFSRYCDYNLPVYVGHSLFFKAFCSKRISAVMCRKRPYLSANLKRYRLSNASLLAVTVKYTDLDNGCSEAVIIDADLIFGGGFHGVKLARERAVESGIYAGAEDAGDGGDDIDGAMQLPSSRGNHNNSNSSGTSSHRSSASGAASNLSHTLNHKVSSNLKSGRKAIGKFLSDFF